MKANTTARCIINRHSQKMININQHGRHHHKIGKLPVTTKEQANDNSGDDEMECYMNDENTPVTIIGQELSHTSTTILCVLLTVHSE